MKTLNRFWNWLPAIIKGIITGQLILFIGQIPLSLIFINLKISPSVPWFLPAIIVWLYIFWKYLDGKWPPLKTSNLRKEYLRASKLTSAQWFWGLTAGGFGMISVMGLIFVISAFGNLPADAYKSPYDLSPYPSWTVISLFVSIAATAAMVEESAFRGYMLSMIQKRHGWILGILITVIMFWISHLSHTYAVPAFIPFFILYSVLHGLMVYYTKSIFPSIIIHFLSDVIILPMQYGVIPDLGKYDFVKYGWLSLTAFIISLPIFFKLHKINRHNQKTID
jgi:membrane protease YdiL (CAAX protease family)